MMLNYRQRNLIRDMHPRRRRAIRNLNINDAGDRETLIRLAGRLGRHNEEIFTNEQRQFLQRRYIRNNLNVEDPVHRIRLMRLAFDGPNPLGAQNPIFTEAQRRFLTERELFGNSDDEDSSMDIDTESYDSDDSGYLLEDDVEEIIGNDPRFEETDRPRNYTWIGVGPRAFVAESSKHKVDKKKNSRTTYDKKLRFLLLNKHDKVNELKNKIRAMIGREKVVYKSSKSPEKKKKVKKRKFTKQQSKSKKVRKRSRIDVKKNNQKNKKSKTKHRHIR